MSSSLISGKYVLCKKSESDEFQVLEDASVFQRDGLIIEIGDTKDLKIKFQPDEIIGSSEFIVLPGFVNSHHHVGLTPFQTGSPDLPLELWWVSRLSKRNVDLYLDTLYSAFELIESGVTTVQHMHSRVPSPLERILFGANEVLRAYNDIGMRVSYSYLIREQNRLVYEPDKKFFKRLPSDLRGDVETLISSQAIPLEENFILFETLHSQYQDYERIRIQLAPANLHWCTDDGLRMVREYADKYQVPIHMHLVESRYQREYARRRTGTTAVKHLQQLGLLGPDLTLGHGVWLTEEDIDLVAESGVRVCTNASSNLRLRSGIAPLNRLADRGVPLAIGIDEAGINDDRDMLLEMRMVMRLHREPGMDEIVPTSAHVLSMATEEGAETTPFRSKIGKLYPGKAADIVLMRWKDIAYPYLDPDTSVVDAIVHRAKSSAVETVIVAGEVIYKDRKFVRVDKQAILAELAAVLSVPLSEGEFKRAKIAKALMPHVKKFYHDEGYNKLSDYSPFYRFNAYH